MHGDEGEGEGDNNNNDNIIVQWQQHCCHHYCHCCIVVSLLLLCSWAHKVRRAMVLVGFESEQVSNSHNPPYWEIPSQGYR